MDLGPKPAMAKHGCHDNESGGIPGSGSSSASATAEGYRALLVRSLHAETVEFPVANAPEECVPFIRRESENRPFGLPAVADPDLAVGQASYLDTVAVGETQRAFDPVETRIFWLISERSASHRTTSLVDVFCPECVYGYESQWICYR